MNKEQEKLVEENIAFAGFMANRFMNTGIEYDELKSIANYGLVKAARDFDMTKKTKFITFAAVVISNEIKMYLKKNKKNLKTISFESIVSDDFNYSPDDFIYDIEKGENRFNQEDLITHHMLNESLNLLSDKERIAIHMYYYEDKEQWYIADKLGCSQSYISRLLQQSIKKLRKYII